LHRSTRFAAANLHREEHRRRAREESAARETETLFAPPEPTADWANLAPVLDAALDTLGETDRQTIVLRYFAQHPFADIAARLHTTEAAAQMRATRALEKLRRALQKRGVTSLSTASALGLALGANAVTAAPTTVAACVITQAAALTTTGGAALGIFSFMTMTTKVSLGVAAVAVFAGGIGVGVQIAPAVGTSADFGTAVTERPTLAKVTDMVPPVEEPNSATVAQIASLRKQLNERDERLKRVLEREAIDQSYLKSMVEEAMQRSKESGQNGKSVFNSLREAGVFIAYINQRARQFRIDYPSAPQPGSEEYADYTKRLDDITRDSALLAQDPLFLGEVLSKDPVRISQAQASYVTASLNLSDDKTAAVTEVLRAAYVEGFADKLSIDDKPADDPSGWEKRRNDLNARAISRIKALLTPQQLAQFGDLGYDYLVFNIQIGDRE
jgi:hypothetical protein